MAAKAEFRAPFASVLGFRVRTAVVLLALFGTVRFVLVLVANATGQYNAVSIVFVVMAALPWVLLTKTGRHRIGIVGPTRWRWILPAAVAGAAWCAATFATFALFWADSASNAFVYIGNSYSAVPAGVSDSDRTIYFVIFAIIGMTFSPIGEELLYRGLAHESLAASLGGVRAGLIDAAAFAVVHLAHFGIVVTAAGWEFLPVQATLWVVAMFAASLVFLGFRALTGSVLGAIVSHAAFNLTMTAAIFYLLDLY